MRVDWVHRVFGSVMLSYLVVSCSGGSVTDIALDQVSEFESAMAAGDVDAAASLFSESWIEVGIPMTEATTAARPPDDEASTGLEFIDIWMDLALQDCAAEDPDEASPVEVRCLAIISGDYSDALGIGAFGLPVLFRSADDGLVSFATDWKTVEDPSFEYPDGTEAYVRSIEAFYVYAAGDPDFANVYTEGIGRPILTPESATAHVAKADEWVVAGKP